MSIGANDCDWDEIELTKRLWTRTSTATDGKERGQEAEPRSLVPSVQNARASS